MNEKDHIRLKVRYTVAFRADGTCLIADDEGEHEADDYEIEIFRSILGVNFGDPGVKTTVTLR